MMKVKSLSKKDLLDYITNNQLIKDNDTKYSMQDSKDVLFLAVSDHKKNKELDEISRLQVKYIGYQGLVDYNSNSTKTGKEYKFHRGDWVDVDPIDWDSFHNIIEKSIKDDQIPHWQVQKITTGDKIISYFKSKIEELKLKKPNGLSSLPHMTERQIELLNKANIRSIQQFMGLPLDWLINHVGIPRTEYYDMIESARRALI